MFPIRDENPSGHTPIVTYSLIALNVLVFLYQVAGPLPFEATIMVYGYIPALFLMDPVGNFYRLFTSMFLHGGPTHLLGNMVYLYIFGDNVEYAFGRTKYLLFYIVSGLGASALHTAVSVASNVPAVGASGAISGILGAYVLLYPRNRIVSLVFWWFGLAELVSIPAYHYIWGWFIWQLIPALLFGESTGVAYWAHVGGFVTGLILTWRYRKRYYERYVVVEEYYVPIWV
ncbi:MAG: rhomboid family intramembrane serine protease [Thermoproteota archaeon]|nr:MAG: rhomboid family intramembrane serine protease [Candidatus Korarchaeota archaeon]